MNSILSTMKNPLSSLIVRYGMAEVCADNCSGHGECLNGTCFCEIRFIGEECRTTNKSYFIAFATVFFLVSLVCFVQLVTSIVAEWKRLKTPSVIRACRITTQKLLYFVVFLASAIRGAYFTSPKSFEDGWYRGLMSAYYPLLLSGSSLIVCFWAEIFHLRDVRWEHRQFLSKSFIAFVAFNVISYSLLLAEFLVSHFLNENEELKSFYSLIFHGCYAFLLFVVVVFFLIYGVEVFFKVRGGYFLEEKDENARLFEQSQALFRGRKVDISQLHQSRLGLLSQATMLLAVAAFLGSETLGSFWKAKVPVASRNIFDLVFRTFEIGVALWFPCVLWNSMRPDKLWILNPKRLLKKEVTATPLETKFEETEDESKECWICYDISRTDAGPMIRPCYCKGDVQAVHYECLKTWLVESQASYCLVCRCRYGLTEGRKMNFGSILAYQTWGQTILILGLAGLSVLAATAVVQLVSNTVGKVLAVGSALLSIYMCIKFLCEKQMEAYHKARVSSLRIQSNVTTISEALVE